MMEIRSIQPEVFEAEVLGLWNANLGSSFPLDSGLYKQNTGYLPEERVCFGAFDSRKPEGLVGFAMARRAGGAGSVSALLVDKAARGQGLGTDLLGACEAWLRAASVQTIRLGADFPHFFPGAPLEADGKPSALEAFLAARGFAAGSLEHDLKGSVALGSNPESTQAPEGLEWIHATPGCRQEAEAFFEKNFPGRWAMEYRLFAEKNLPSPDLLFLQDEKRKTILGFCRLCHPESPWRQPGLYWKGLLGPRAGALGPVGLDKDLRGRGLGLLLFRRGLEDLARAGLDTVVIDWTDLVDFYAKEGFTIWKSYRPYAKRLEP